MSVLRKRLLIGTAFFVVILLGVAAFFYRPTRMALERAESFQFRRMLVTQLESKGTYRFFFVTNRNSDENNVPLEEQFTNQRTTGLTFGLFDTRIEPSLGIGMLINPTDWFQNEEIQLTNIEKLDQESFVQQLRRQVAGSPHKSLLININGFRERFPSALRKTAFLSHVLDIDTPVLTFDWPGDQGTSPRRYRRAQSIAGESGLELAHTLRIITRLVQPERIWLVANSMGAQVVVHAFNTLYRENERDAIPIKIEKVVLTAPDVDRQEFTDQFKKKIAALSKSLTVYVSSNDRALLMSRIINRGRRLGESTLNPGEIDQYEEASNFFALVGSNSDLVTMVDVTPINRTRNFHSFSLETPEFFDDLYLRLVNKKMPRSRPEYKVDTPDGRTYWILTRAR